MARNKKKGGGSDIPEWLVTFADLMSILVCFFVLIISFSIQDEQKLQVVAGSMRDAFGVRTVEFKAGMIEITGVPVRDYIKKVTNEAVPINSDFANENHNRRQKQGPEANTHDIEETDIERPRQFATAAASLRQALQELPEISELSKNIVVEETPDGLNISLVDQDGRSMFPSGSKYPYEHLRVILAKMAPILRAMPNRIMISGHTTAAQPGLNPTYTAWELAADRANATRQILNEFGISSDQIHSVVGKADTEPYFPNDPFFAANRRISVLLMADAPPLPIELQP